MYQIYIHRVKQYNLFFTYCLPENNIIGNAVTVPMKAAGPGYFISHALTNRPSLLELNATKIEITMK